MREEAPELWDQELRGLLKETSPSQFHFPASWDMGWAEGLTGGGGQRDPGKALSRLRTSLRDVGGKRASGEVSEEEVGAILVGMAPKSGYYWNCCLVSWLITLLPFTVTQQGAARDDRCLRALLWGDRKWEVLERPFIPRPAWKHEVPQRPRVTRQHPGLAAAPTLSCPTCGGCSVMGMVFSHQTVSSELGRISAR